MSALGLTPTQANLLGFISARMKTGDVAPTLDEMKDHLGLRSKSGVHRILGGLVERGHITKLEYRARAISLVKRCPHCGGAL